MGLFGKRMKDPVRGEGYVVSCWDRPEADRGDCRVTLTVRAAGVSSRTVEVSERNVKKEMWPRSGQTLPITVDREDPANVQVEWDSVTPQAAPTTATTTAAPAPAAPAPTPAPAPEAALENQVEQAISSAEAYMKNSGQVWPLAGGANLTDQIRQAMEMAQQFQQAYDPSAMSVGQPAPTAPQPSGEDKIIADLERLAKLKADGVLTAEEFETQKKKILGGGTP